jgi:MFS family permease
MWNEGDEGVRPTERADALPVKTRQRDAKFILVMRGLRPMAYGLLAVILGVVLAGEGFSPAAIGVLITISLIGDMVGTYVIGLAAAPLARRFGLLNTMVFTHLPSNVLLALVALAPTFPIAAALLLLRQMLSQMDIPTRQAYTMALVDPEERTAAASMTSLARSLGSATSPIVSGLLLQGTLLVLGLPFILAGTLKAAYDLSLWAIFRRVHLPEEEDRSRQAAAGHAQPPSHEAGVSPEHGRKGNP